MRVPFTTSKREACLAQMSVPTAGSCDVTREADGLLHMLREANGVEAAR